MSTDIAKLKRRFSFLDKIFWIGFYSKKWIDSINKAKIDLFMDTIGKEAEPIVDKYINAEYPSGPIGNRVWVFWYTGFDTAPPIVRKCIQEMQKVHGIDLVILDKDNLDEYFIWDPVIKERFEEKSISITFLTDVIRNQLMARLGGFWFDATLLVLDKDFIKDHSSLDFYSLRHGDYAACSHFNDGRWSSFLSGTPAGHPLPCFATDFFVWYFSQYKEICNYFLIDYVYMLAYLSFPELHKEIDDLEVENEDVFFMGRNIRKKCSDKEWNHVLQNNCIQKLIWNVDIAHEMNENSVISRVIAY